jgi:WD40 repeat protein/tRNA A-37 threonylcarbamoyl transferase component Bud32
MPTQHTCPLGHTWETELIDEGPQRIICPVCESLKTAPFPPPSLPQKPPALEGFDVERELGRGGMGVVYKARHRTLARDCALKLIANAALAGTEELERFRTEARLAAGLNHPNIVHVYEVGEHEGLPWFALEYVEGYSLDQRIDGQPQPALSSAALVETLARAVHFAHQKQIIHRDLKPANVLLSADGVPKVADFGLAKQLHTARSITEPGAIIGTPSYMAPEQAWGKSEIRQVGPTTDVWALGAILYECLTGRPPFRGETVIDTLQQVVDQEPVKPSELNARTPSDLEIICLKCLHKDPRKRYGSAEALADDLGRFLAGKPILARPVGAGERAVKWMKRRPAVTALLAGIVGVTVIGFVLVVWQWREAEAARKKEQERAEAERRATLAARKARDEADQQRRQAQKLNVSLALERGLTLCEGGEVRAGFLWLARSLALAREVGATSQEQSLRRLLALWTPAFHHPSAYLAHPSEIEAIAQGPGGSVLTGCRDGTATLWDAGGRKVAVLRGHQGAVTAIAFHPGGKLLVTGSRDKTARLWSPATGKQIGEPLQHREPVTAAAFSRDGQVVWTGTRGDVQRWDTATGKPIGELLPIDGEVRAIAFSPDGKTVAATTEESTRGQTRLWEAGSGKLIGGPLVPPGSRTFTWYTSGTRMSPSVAFSPDSRTLITALANADLWDTATGKHLGVVLKNPGMFQAVAWSPDGKTILTGSIQGNESQATAQVWTVAGKPIGKPLRHAGAVRTVAFSPDGALALTGSDDQTARVWDAATGEPAGTPLRLEKTVRYVAFGAEGKTILTAGDDRTAILWSVDTRVARPRLLPSRGLVNVVAFRPDGKVLVTGADDRLARLWSAVTGALIGAPLVHEGGVTAVAFRDDGLLMTATRRGEVRLWKTDGTPASEPLQHPAQQKSKVHLPNGTILTYQDPGTEITVAVFSPDGKTAVTGSKNNTAQLWDVDRGKAIGQLLRHDAQVVAVAFSPDSRIVYTATPDKIVRRWDAATGKLVGKVLKVPEPLWAMALSPDGRTLVTAGGSERKPSEARLWRLDRDEPIGSPLRHQGRMLAAIFSPDGKAVATGCDNGTARLWDAVTGKPLGEPQRHRGPVQALAFTRDGLLLVTGSKDGMARMWDAATGKRAGEPLVFPDPVVAVTLHPEGKAFAAGSGDTETKDNKVSSWGQARFRRLPTALEGDPERIRLWIQVNTGMELGPNERVIDLDEATVRQRWRELREIGGPPG